MRARVCCLGGRTTSPDLISGVDRWPQDPSEFSRARDPSEIGCTRLRCLECKAFVRSEPNLACTVRAPHTLAELHEARQWADLPWVTPTRRSRLFACRCTLWLETSSHAMEEERDTLDAPLPPWRCDGHPLPTLPIVVDSVAIDENTDLAALADRVLEGFVPEQSEATFRDVPPWWLVRLWGRLDGLPAGRHLAEYMGTWLDDEVEGKRAATLLFFRAMPRDPTAAVALEAIRRSPDRTGTPLAVPVRRKTPYLVRPLDVALARLEDGFDPRDPVDLLARNILRSALLHGTVADDFAGELLCIIDPEWLARNLPAIEEASPGSWRVLLETVTAKAPVEFAVIAGVALATDARFAHRDALLSWAKEEWRRTRGYALPILAALKAPAKRDPAVILREIERSGLDLASAQRLGAEIGNVAAEQAFDAAITLASADETVRSAFLEGVRTGAPKFYGEHGDALKEALGLGFGQS